MGAGGSVALPEGDSVTLDEAKAYAGEGGWNEDAQKAFDAAAAEGKSPRTPSPPTRPSRTRPRPSSRRASGGSRSEEPDQAAGEVR